MKNIWLKISALALTVIMVATVLPACDCQKVSAADSYVAIVPDVLHSRSGGSRVTITFKRRPIREG